MAGKNSPQSHLDRTLTKSADTSQARAKVSKADADASGQTGDIAAASQDPSDSTDQIPAWVEAAMRADARAQPWKQWVVVDENSTDADEFVVGKDEAQRRIPGLGK
jgi:hypothetical protein